MLDVIRKKLRELYVSLLKISIYTIILYIFFATSNYGGFIYTFCKIGLYICVVSAILTCLLIIYYQSKYNHEKEFIDKSKAYDEAYSRYYEYYHKQFNNKINNKPNNNDYDNALKLMKLTSNSTSTDIKKAYRDLALKWHPDKWSMSSKENQDIANNNFKKLNTAYEIIKKQKGIQ